MNKVKNIIFKLLHRVKNSYDAFELRQKQQALIASFSSVGENCTIPFPCLILNPQYITIGKNFQSLYNLRIEAWDFYMGQKFYPKIIIGDNVCMNTDVHIGCIDKIVVGNNVLFASRIFITDHFHGKISSAHVHLPPIERPLFSKGPVIIEDNVWIGEGVSIMPNITIGKNSIIGANSVVTQNVPANSVFAGSPARLIKYFS